MPLPYDDTLQLAAEGALLQGVEQVVCFYNRRFVFGTGLIYFFDGVGKLHLFF